MPILARSRRVRRGRTALIPTGDNVRQAVRDIAENFDITLVDTAGSALEAPGRRALGLRPRADALSAIGAGHLALRIRVKPIAGSDVADRSR